MMCDLIRATIELAIGQMRIAEHDRDRIGRAVDLRFEELVRAQLARIRASRVVPFDEELLALRVRSIGSAAMRRSGSATMPWSKRSKWPIIRVIVASSKRSVLYSIEPRKRPPLALTNSVRSNFNVPEIDGVAAVEQLCLQPGDVDRARAVLQHERDLEQRRVCEAALRPASSTSFSNGRS